VLSLNDIVAKYGLSAMEARRFVNAVRREKIDPDVVQLLLESCNFVCCACKGIKSPAYIRADNAVG